MHALDQIKKVTNSFQYIIARLEQCFAGSVQTQYPLVDSNRNETVAAPYFSFECKWYLLAVRVTEYPPAAKK